MIRLLVAFSVLIFLTTGCGVLIGDLPCCGPATATPSPTLPPPKVLPPRPTLPSKPGEQKPPAARPTEPRAAMPAPTATTAPAPQAVASPQSADAANTYWITNPTSGARLYTQVVLPKNASGKLPALILVPGGIGWGGNFLDPPNRAQILADAGFVVVVFDPDGRGKSA
ncbi:MAG: hypothetical protein AB1817_04995, partial [Chloroflexota bacterium]